MSLLSLPTEILCLVAVQLDNIETFTSASSTCRTLRAAFRSTHPNTLLRLAAASSPTFFSPHPYYLIAATARSVSSWATSSTPTYLSNERVKSLRKAFQGGLYPLYDFCIQHGELPLQRIREMHEARFAIVNPLSDSIDRMAGKQWLKTPRFWQGGVSEANTLYTDAERAAWQVVIYGEFFGMSMDEFLSSAGGRSMEETGEDEEEGGEGEGGLGLAARMDYLTYALPDDEEPNHIGADDNDPIQFSYLEEQRALRHIVRCNRWRRMWGAAIREVLDASFEDEPLDKEDWRKKLLRDALMVQGLRGMEMVTRKEGKELSRECLMKVRWIGERVSGVEREPRVRMLGRPTRGSGGRGNVRVSVVPDPTRELHVVSRRGWYASQD
ncbi:hypothetical protein BJX70DRAFT_400408 [Aspergillus crustosus]